MHIIPVGFCGSSQLIIMYNDRSAQTNRNPNVTYICSQTVSHSESPKSKNETRCAWILPFPTKKLLDLSFLAFLTAETKEGRKWL